MKYLILFIILISSICHGVEILHEESLKGYTFSIVEFNGHRYLHVRNHWNSAGNKMMHDPDCPCIREAVEKLTKAKP